MRAACALALALAAANPGSATAQTLAQRGYAETAFLFFPQRATNDPVRAMGDLLVREDLFVRPAAWVQFSAGIDLRANTHDQVDDDWTPDFSDRRIRRPPLAVRRLAATIARGPLTIDAGKQFIRWGKTDIITPTDRFAPRDFLNVITSEFLPVLGVRGSYQAKDETFEGVWLPRLTPSRVPLFDQRWTAVPAEAAGVPFVDGGSRLPDGSQFGVRWSHVGSALEFALSVFDGFNHLPNIASNVTGLPAALPASITLIREYPAIRAYGAEAAVPTRWFTLKGEAEYFGNKRTSGDADTAADEQSDDFVLYVVQLERQSGEWVFVGGYAGEAVTVRRSTVVFAPDRGLARSIVGRASYTIDPRRSIAFEGAARQSGDGAYGKLEYSETRGQHWRLTASGVAIAGRSDDFLGQYRRNSHASLTLRYSF